MGKNCPIMSNKTFKVLFKIFLFITFIVLLFLIVNETPFKTEMLEDDVNSKLQYKDYDVRKNDTDIQMLCYIKDSLEESELYCFNTSEEKFEAVTLEIDKNQIYDKPLSLITISENDAKSKVIVEKMSLIPKKDMVSILQALTLEDFIIYKDTTNNDVYINYHDYIRTQVFLLKYYEDEAKDLTLYSTVLEDLRDYISATCSIENQPISLYPANPEDISYISKIDKELADRITENSKGLLEFIYHNILYIQEQNNIEGMCNVSYVENIDFLNKNITNLKIALSFLQGTQDFEESQKYNEAFTQFREDILCGSEELSTKLDFMTDYLPLIDVELLDQLVSSSEDTETKKIQLSNLLYYVCTNMDCESYVQVVNLLNKYY